MNIKSVSSAGINFSAVKIAFPANVENRDKLQSIARSKEFPRDIYSFSLYSSELPAFDTNTVVIFGKNAKDEKKSYELLKSEFDKCELLPYFYIKKMDRSTFNNLSDKQLRTLGLDPNAKWKGSMIDIRDLNN